MTNARRRLVLLLHACIGAWLPAASAQPPEPVPVIAAASDLKFALDDLIAAFRGETGREVRVSYGSSGNFYRQILQDAPFQLFLSADEDFVFRLADQGRTADRGRRYAIGRLALFAPNGSAVQVDPDLTDLRRALADGRLSRLAIANPDHAPYGRAAREALERTGLWASAQPRLVLGENVSQAAQFAASGSAQAGLFALSLALAPAFSAAGRHAVVSDALHAPLSQRMVLIRNAGGTARAFYDYLERPAARRVLARYGFALPDDPPR